MPWIPTTRRAWARRLRAGSRSADTGKVISAELVEANPVLDERNITAKLGVELLASLLGKRIL